MSETIVVAAEQDRIQVNPGEVVQTDITVQNLSVAVGVFSIAVEGLDPTWYNLSSTSVSLFPGDRTTTTLVVMPPRTSSSLASSYPITVRVTSQKEDADEETLPLSVEIGSFSEFVTDYRPQRARGARVSHTLSITNMGNADLPFELSAQDATGVCQFEFDPEKPVVAPGSTSEVAVTVRGKRPLRGLPAQYQYEIAVTPTEGTAEPTTTFGQLEVPPRIPSWIFRVAILLVLGVGIAGAVYYFVFYEPPVAVAEFQVSPNRVVLTENETSQIAAIARDAEGNSLLGRQVAWNSSNPRAVRVSPEGRITGLVTTEVPVIVTASLLDQDLDAEPPSVAVTVLPTLVSTDCIRYSPESLKFGVSQNSSLVVTDGVEEVITLLPDDDQVNAFRLATRHTMRCFIGREDTGNGLEGAEVEFWIGGSGLATSPISPVDCDAYAPSNTQVRMDAAGDWILTDGTSLLIRLDSQEDAQAALVLARRHSSRCFLNRQLNEAREISYSLTHYWQ